MEDQITQLESEFFTCCNMRYALWIFKCALWRIHSDNADESIIRMIDTVEAVSMSLAIHADSVRTQLLALGWD